MIIWFDICKFISKKNLAVKNVLKNLENIIGLKDIIRNNIINIIAQNVNKQLRNDILAN